MSNTHDYSGKNRRFGHDYTAISLSDDGREGRFLGWGHGVKAGDFLIIDRDPTSTTRFQVKSIKYRINPNDMWDAVLVFSPRTGIAEPHAKGAA